MTDDGSLRASDADREATVARLQQAFSEGRLELTELDERTSAAYAAKTLADLAELTRDLPAAGPPPVPAPEHPPQQRDRLGEVARGAWNILPLVVVISIAVWAVVGVSSGHWVHPWWVWIVVFWGWGRWHGHGRRRR